MSWLYQLEVRAQRLIPLSWGWCRCWRLYTWENFAFVDRVTEAVNIGNDSCIEFRMGLKSDFQLLSQQCAGNLVEQRWKAGGQVFLATQANRLVGVAWLQTNTYTDLDTDIKVQLSRDQNWLYGSWVARNLRGQGVYRRLLAKAIPVLKSQHGLQQLCLAIDRSNGRSQRVHERMGANSIGSLTRIHAFGRAYGRLTWKNARQAEGPGIAAAEAPFDDIRMDLARKLTNG